jgi:hypothetical protein
MAYDSTRDLYASVARGAVHPGRKAEAVVPDDEVDFETYPKSLWIGTAGVVQVVPVDNETDDPVPFKVAQGPFPMQVRRVFATDTTADDIVAVYY